MVLRVTRSTIGCTLCCLMQEKELRMKLLRSLLFAPGNRPRMLAKAGTVGADAVIIDLEDAVPIAEKVATRPAVREAIDQIATVHSTPVYVRINPLGAKTTFSQDLALGDLESIVCPNLAGVIFPKAESAMEIKRIDEAIAHLESARGIPVGQVEVVPILETAKGIMGAMEIAQACHRRVPRVCFGAGDLTLDLGIEWTRGETEVLFGRMWVVMASRAAEIEPPLDTVFPRIDDDEGLVRAASLAKQLGFQGKCCIHPRQVQQVNQVFSPSAEQVEYARRVVELFDQAELDGKASVMMDGKMLDYPIVEKERRLLKRAATIGSRC